MNARRFFSQFAAVSIAAGGVLFIAPQHAEATGGNCSSIRQEKEDTGYNSFRVRASCSSLQADSKAKGVLEKAGASDPETAWFTALNTYKYSNYTTCSPLATCNNTRVDIGHV